VDRAPAIPPAASSGDKIDDPLTMARICPNPNAWSAVHAQLLRFAEKHPCTPSAPPTPLILNGWVFSDDYQKKLAWEDTVAWAARNGCLEIVESVPEKDFHCGASEPRMHIVGYSPWNRESKPRPSPEELERHLELLQSRWPEIVGPTLGPATRPVSFSGRKRRRLIVRAVASVHPPWGDWDYRVAAAAERITFTLFRAAVNREIAPHEVDHIDFEVDEDAGDHVAGKAPPPASIRSEE
jgi:hypothetical protein